MVKMRRGESRSFNNWLRVRVIAQGLTIAAVVAGTYSFGFRAEAGSKGQAEADLEKRREEKVGKERAEFEGRLKMAEELHRAEDAGKVVAPPTRKSGGWFGGSSSAEPEKKA